MGPAIRSTRLLTHACLLLTLAWGCQERESTTLLDKPRPHVRAASVQSVEPRPRAHHLAPLVAHRRARLSPRAGGQVIEVAVREGEAVEAGAVLVRFVDADPQGNLISARARIDALQESLTDTQRELEDSRHLLERGAGTTREVERLTTQQAGLLAQLREAKGNLVRARDRIGAATLTAPFAGVITQVATEAGEYIGPGALALVLAQLDPIAVEVQLTQAQLEQAGPNGEGLQFRVQVRGEARVPELEWIRSESLAGDGTFTARLQLANPDHALRAGEFVEVEVFGPVRGAVKAVPATAVRWVGDDAYVLRIHDDGGSRVERVDVTPLDDHGDQVVIAGEVNVGDRVVRTGPVALRPGDEVEVVDDPAAKPS